MTLSFQPRDSVHEHSRDALRKGSRSFNTAALLFDPQTRESARLLYAWCRHCDDVIDGQQLGGGQPGPRVRMVGTPAHRLAALRRATIEAHGGRGLSHPVFAAFHRVTARHQIPLDLPLALLDGFAMDVQGRRYRSIDDTLAYCYHVAGVVGLMMARIMGVRGEAILDRACDLGIAFQLTNIARDVIEDWRNGRVYIPLSLLKKAGLSPADMGEPAHRRALMQVVGELLAIAEPYYRSASVGVEALPPRSAWAVEAARRIYRAIGMQILERGEAGLDERAAIPHREKLVHGAAALRVVLARFPRGQFQAPPRGELWSRPPGDAA
jgi:phytoene synthase